MASAGLYQARDEEAEVRVCEDREAPSGQAEEVAWVRGLACEGEEAGNRGVEDDGEDAAPDLACQGDLEGGTSRLAQGLGTQMVAASCPGEAEVLSSRMASDQASS